MLTSSLIDTYQSVTFMQIYNFKKKKESRYLVKKQIGNTFTSENKKNNVCMNLRNCSRIEHITSSSHPETSTNTAYCCRQGMYIVFVLLF